MSEIPDKDVDEFSNIEKDGLKYIKNEENYLILSGVLPIFIVIVQVINLLYIFTAPPIHPMDPQPTPNPVNIFTPIIILLIISSMGLLSFKYLLDWKKMVEKYEGKKPGQKKTLTSIFYDIIKNTEKIRILFILVNSMSAYYLIWFILWALSILDLHHPAPPLHVNILNALSLIGLLIYLIIEWRHYHRWNKKLTQIKRLEKQVFDEICGSKEFD